MLDGLFLDTRINQHWKYSGIDSLENARDRKHFKQYPYDIDYIYNSRGFRDQEWPETDLEDCIWCFGDSFTVGIGSPYQHIWPQVLERKTGRRTINISMDGASNDWICRKLHYLLRNIQPQNVVVLWSYFERREDPAENIPDEKRRLQLPTQTDQAHRDNLTHFQEITQWLVSDHRSNFINAMVPEHYIIDVDISQLGWQAIRGPDWPELIPRTLEQFQSLPQWIREEIETQHDQNIQEMVRYCSIMDQLPNFLGTVPKLDLARDGHHFDIQGSEWFVDRIIPRLL